MTRAAPASSPEAVAFRRTLVVVLMVMVSLVTAAAILLARRAIATDEQAARLGDFERAWATGHHLLQVRHSLLVERCRALARKPRIHAALEDQALDLLYLSARDELRDILLDPRGNAEPSRQTNYSLHAYFYRFLHREGQVIHPEGDAHAGELTAAEEAALALPHLPDQPQLGYLATPDGRYPAAELIAMPIVSLETDQPIAALVLGFPPVQFRQQALEEATGLSGIWFGGRLYLGTGGASVHDDVHHILAERLGAAGALTEGEVSTVTADGEPLTIFFKSLNPGSLFAPAFAVSVFSRQEMMRRQERRAWQIMAAGAALVLAAWWVSERISRQLARPVERLVHDSAEQRTQRARVEAALQSTNVELQRAARFSADASHQLKTPVTVLRAGLEELLAKGHLTPQECDEVASLVHQTYRLSSIIEDLLLLSRLDAGRLQLQFSAVDLSALIEASLDDLHALPDELGLSIDTDFTPHLLIAGEKRYTTLILQNLLENARKYNRPGGRIRLQARARDDAIVLRIANTALRPIPPEAKAHIFERFHRGSVGENIPGYGLGLNLARELARIHGGNLTLERSDEQWTELEVRFRAASVLSPPQGAIG